MSASAEIPSPVATGEIVGGKYRVGDVLGAGGMGVVVAAEHVSFEQHVAVKLMHLDAGPTAMKRFHREANIVVALRSEHVCRVIDHGVLASGHLYIVMERLDGCDLAELSAQRGAIPVAQAVEYVLQAAEALAEAHLLGVVHRDIKPSNIFLTNRPDGSPCIKLLDFGISKVRDAAALTATGSLLGSIHFMSPEQLIDPKTADLRSDIWSLGVTFFELLVGRPPFDAQTLSEMAALIMDEPAPDLAVLGPTLAEVAPVVQRCLEEDPDARYQNLAELALAVMPMAPARARPYVERIVAMYERSGWLRPVAYAHTTPSIATQTGIATGPTLHLPSPEAPPALVDVAAGVSPPRATSERRGMGWRAALGLGIGALVLGGGALWVASSRARRPDPEREEEPAAAPHHPKSGKKKRRGKGTAAAPPPAPLRIPRAPREGEESWLSTTPLSHALLAVRGPATRALLIRFFSGYAEIILVANDETLALEQFYWIDGKLVGPEAYPHRRLTSKRDAEQRTTRLANISLAVVPGLLEAARPRMPTGLAYAFHTIELKVVDSAPVWEVAATHGQTLRFDLEGRYLAGP